MLHFGFPDGFDGQPGTPNRILWSALIASPLGGFGGARPPLQQIPKRKPRRWRAPGPCHKRLPVRPATQGTSMALPNQPMKFAKSAFGSTAVQKGEAAAPGVDPVNATASSMDRGELGQSPRVYRRGNVAPD